MKQVTSPRGCPKNCLAEPGATMVEVGSFIVVVPRIFWALLRRDGASLDHAPWRRQGAGIPRVALISGIHGRRTRARVPGQLAPASSLSVASALSRFILSMMRAV